MPSWMPGSLGCICLLSTWATPKSTPAVSNIPMDVNYRCSTDTIYSGITLKLPWVDTKPCIINWPQWKSNYFMFGLNG